VTWIGEGKARGMWWTMKVRGSVSPGIDRKGHLQPHHSQTTAAVKKNTSLYTGERVSAGKSAGSGRACRIPESTEQKTGLQLKNGGVTEPCSLGRPRSIGHRSLWM